MKSSWLRMICFLGGLLMLLPAAMAEEDDPELLIEEIIEYVDLDAVSYGDTEWTFPVALEDMSPDLVRLANKHYLLEKDFVVQPLVTVKTRNKDGSNGGVFKASGAKMQLQEACAEALHAMSEAALKDGLRMYLKSAYRSYQTQNTMYYNRLKKNNGRDDGWVSKPGSSDHQTGLGCDVVPRAWRDKSMNEKMASEEVCIWMAAHCHEYGFILRYPADKEDLTEINFEPWHMRYVGIPVATYIMNNGLCLEEFTQELQAAIEDFISRGGDPSYVSAFVQTPSEEAD